MALPSTGSGSQRLDLVTRGLDVGARSIDLLQTIAEIANSPNGAIQAASKFMYWLGTERVNQEDLGHCLSRAKDLAHPNMAGLAFCSGVMEGIEALPKSILEPFKSISSGSLGRFLVLDHSLRWITSTITSFYQFHDEKFIAYAMTALIVRIYDEREGNRPTPRSNFWSDPTYLRMMPVVKKITSSIWLNIVNSKKESLPLPDKLRRICPVGHHLDSEDLVEALARLKNPRRGPHVIITSRYMLGNLSLWLLYHFSGLFRVVVGGEIVYETRQGHEEQEIELRVGVRCGDNSQCANNNDRDERRQFEMAENIAGHWHEFFVGSSKPSPTLGSASRARRALYGFEDGQSTPSQKMSAINSHIRKVALDLARWLCSLRVEPCPQAASWIVYKINLDRRGASDNHHTLMTDLLKRSPAILQNPWGPGLPKDWTPEDAVQIWSPEGFIEVAEWLKNLSGLSENTDKAIDARQSSVWRCFPGLADLLAEAEVQCRCMNCIQKRGVTPLQPGCRKFYAYGAVLSLLGHSIADAFGADSASGSEEMSSPAVGSDIYSVEHVLLDIVRKSQVVWQTWFEVASSVYLGRRYSNAQARRHGNGVLPADNSMTIAIQYGDLAVVAPWVDLSREVSHLGSFGFVPVPGRLCVSTAKQPRCRSDYQVLDDVFAVIKTRPTEAIEIDDAPRHAGGPRDIGPELDGHEVEVDAILFPSEDEVYFLMTRARAGKWSRLVDPCAAAIMQAKNFRGIQSRRCQHEPVHKAENSASQLCDLTLAYSFEKLLGEWPPGALDKLHMSNVLDTYLKYNIAVALAGGGIVTVNRSDCWICPASRLLTLQRKRIRMSSGLFLINASPFLKEGQDRDGRGKLITESGGVVIEQD
ncbi:hypothetical protein BU26DRAFT_522528 [Trematosphaeria pertusa]|uniref:Uncharacterized protein n=1 Tax=Trematosphaeria pertusa TaxID=390896 RepID=A0A6A6I3D2_9PLEO|nr:uncharacterized protein BU26DRAFT_522528 [Trematosphaeria pertusa]KAF2244757.1 hypothetical protein BU26DRAFT_522528 [Trematosphaeria pertusa]